jgi:hypothetical protein
MNYYSYQPLLEVSMKLQLFSIVGVVVFLSQATARADQATEAQAKEVKSLQGEWQLESIEVN